MFSPNKFFGGLKSQLLFDKNDGGSSGGGGGKKASGETFKPDIKTVKDVSLFEVQTAFDNVFSKGELESSVLSCLNVSRSVGVKKTIARKVAEILHEEFVPEIKKQIDESGVSIESLEELEQALRKVIADQNVEIPLLLNPDGNAVGKTYDLKDSERPLVVETIRLLAKKGIVEKEDPEEDIKKLAMEDFSYHIRRLVNLVFIGKERKTSANLKVPVSLEKDPETSRGNYFAEKIIENNGEGAKIFQEILEKRKQYPNKKAQIDAQQSVALVEELKPFMHDYEDQDGDVEIIGRKKLSMHEKSLAVALDSLNSRYSDLMSKADDEGKKRLEEFREREVMPLEAPLEKVGDAKKRTDAVLLCLDDLGMQMDGEYATRKVKEYLLGIEKVALERIKKIDPSKENSGAFRDYSVKLQIARNFLEKKGIVDGRHINNDEIAKTQQEINQRLRNEWDKLFTPAGTDQALSVSSEQIKPAEKHEEKWRNDFEKAV